MGRPSASNQHPLLAEAVRLCGGSQARLSEASGISQQTISSLLRYERQISVSGALAIHRATSGAISAAALRPDIWPNPASVPVASKPARAPRKSRQARSASVAP